MKFIYIVKDVLHRYPPCISQIVMLREYGINVTVVTEMCDKITEDMLVALGARVVLLGDFKARTNYLDRLRRLFKFKRTALKALKTIYEENDVIWVGTERTGMMLKRYLKDKKFIFNDLELNDTNFLYKKSVGKCVKYASGVVACELNRARIMKMWYGLKDVPFVMQNKPYYEMKCSKTREVESFVKKLEEKKCILYQGILDDERPLDMIAKALNKTKDKYTFVIIGNGRSELETNKYIERLREIYSNIIYGGYFPAPQHLYITQSAYIGVAIYDSSSLNTLFCAPNKTFEYAKYGVPILGSDIPGLQLTVEKYGAGVCVDIENPEQIAMAIDDIADDYEKYQENTKKFYNSVDNRKVMKQVLEKLDCEGK